MTAVCPSNLDDYAAFVRRMTTNRVPGCQWCVDDLPGVYVWCFCREDCGHKHCPLREAPYVPPPIPKFVQEGNP